MSAPLLPPTPRAAGRPKGSFQKVNGLIIVEGVSLAVMTDDVEILGAFKPTVFGCGTQVVIQGAKNGIVSVTQGELSARIPERFLKLVGRK